MATNRLHPSSGARRRTAVVVACIPALIAIDTEVRTPSMVSETETRYDVETPADEYHEGEEELEGRVSPQHDSRRPTVTAAFQRESYRPGSLARLTIAGPATRVSIQLFRAGPERTEPRANDVMTGAPVTPRIPVGAVVGRRVVRIPVGRWQSGLYFARLTAHGKRVGHAPFILRPARLGEHRIAVVLPTFTWQAYNRRDTNGDGRGETWYADWHRKTALLERPYLYRGVPPYYGRYDEPFLRWLAHTGRAVDYLGDADLDAVGSGDHLAGAYSLLVFPGHHEYVTEHEYDVVERFRDLGGNLMFLSANNFFWKVVRRGNVLTKVKQWRDLGRPEAGLIGVQYIGNDRGGHRGPWVVRTTAETPWLFAGTGIERGSRFGPDAGIEIDATAPNSPRGTKVIAEIPELFGPRFTAQMTYYETPRGAQVFAAGAFSLARLVWEPDVRPLLENLWRQLARA